MGAEERTPPGLIVREATVADNDSLIALELQPPLVIGREEESYDRSPDFFACHRLQGEYRIVLAELDRRAVGVMAGVIHTPVIQRRPHRLVYIRQARIHPEFRGRGLAWALSRDLFAWAGTRRAEGPYYLIAPENEPSLTFAERGGGRWPVDVSLLEFDVSEAPQRPAERIAERHLGEVVRLVNATHAGQDFFEPLTAESLAARLRRDRQYSIADLFGVFEGGALVAVAGLWDKGATTERVRTDRTTGLTARSRGAAVVDWGWAAGRREACAELLRGLAAAARALGRSSLTICEPAAGALPDPGLPVRRVAASLFTPTIGPPPPESVRGLYLDLLYV